MMIYGTVRYSTAEYGEWRRMKEEMRHSEGIINAQRQYVLYKISNTVCC